MKYIFLGCSVWSIPRGTAFHPNPLKKWNEIAKMHQICVPAFSMMKQDFSNQKKVLGRWSTPTCWKLNKFNFWSHSATMGMLKVATSDLPLNDFGESPKIEKSKVSRLSHFWRVFSKWVGVLEHAGSGQHDRSTPYSPMLVIYTKLMKFRFFKNRFIFFLVEC